MVSHVFIAICMFPLSIVVYWAYGDKVCQNPNTICLVFNCISNYIFGLFITIDDLINVIDSGNGRSYGLLLETL